MTGELIGWQRERGARLDGDRALDFGDPAGEYRAIQEGAALVDRSGWSVLRLGGERPLEFLHAYVSQEVRVEPGRGAYGCVMTAKGHLVADVWVLARAEDVLVLAAPGAGEPLLRHLRKYALLARVPVELAGDLAVLALWGPGAEGALAAAVGVGPALTEPLQHAAVERPEGALTVVRDDAVGVGGWTLVAPRAGLAPLCDALVAAGATPVGETAAEQARVEAGVPRFGVDMDADTIPLEAGLLDRAISTTKGCYLGQEVIARVLHRGRVNRELTGLVLSERPESLPADLFDGERRVGAVTSCVGSPRLDGAALGLGLVHRKAREGGRELTVGAPGAAVTATLRSLPVAAG